MKEKVTTAKAFISALAICSLLLINFFALQQGVDATLTSTIAAIIGGIAGYEVAIKRR